MQANNIVDYEINSTKISGVYKGAEMNRYAKVDVVNNFDSVFLRGKQTHYMRSDKANLQGDIIKFVSNAKYENNESMVFSSQEILYNKKNKTISSKVPFVATQNTDKITGKSADYDLNKKQLSAKGIKAWIEQER